MTESESQTISLAEARNAPVEVGDQGNALASGSDPFTPNHQKHYAQQLGWIGKVIGGKKEKAGNIAFVAIFLCVLLIGALLWLMSSAEDGKASALGNIAAAIIAVMSGALGFVFGRGGNQSDS